MIGWMCVTCVFWPREQRQEMTGFVQDIYIKKKEEENKRRGKMFYDEIDYKSQ